MATQKKLKEYPAYFRELFIEALIRPVELCCSDRSEAIAYRGRLYAFQNAIREDLDYDPVLSIIEPVVVLKVDTNTLTITAKEKTNGKKRRS